MVTKLIQKETVSADTFINRAEYYCLSTDEKPSPDHPGDVLLETNTSKVFVADGTAWAEL